MRLEKTRLRRFAPLLLSALLIPASAAALTAGGDVVVFTGLPGDVESETAYRSQVERLLEILALPQAKPRRVFVLNDTGDPGTVPAGLEVEVRSASREGFLKLGDELDAPVVVFAWGHGGLMGRDAVFHVRGPRLRAADFHALADAVGGPSSWVLLFRGSGAFARALSAPGREILSSENATAFKSDPVAVRLVLEILRESPGLSLAGLAERLGPTTVSWYEEQHLARQEEPTLWLGDAAPRQVATAGAKEAAAEEPRETAAAPASWDDVERVAAADHPGTSAVVLRRTLSYVLADNPALQNESDELIQILTPEGTAHADFDVAYHPPGEKITFLDLEVLRPDGTVVRLPPEEIRDATPTALPEYRPPTRKVFSLPEAGPGAVLRVHYRREWRRYPLPHVPLEVPLAGDLPVLASRVEVRVAREAPLHWAFRGYPRAEPEIAETPYGKSFTWTFPALDAVADEALAAPQRAPTLLVSTFPSWEEFSAWYRRLIREADVLTPEIEAKAVELTAGAAGARDKVAALYDFVTGLRYVAIPFGVNSHRPHAAANVFANRYGDCKDKANLFNTMLAAVGIEADLVLVPRFSQAYDEVPGLGFNHAISRVHLDGEVIWADTTDDGARFGLLPPGDPGRNVLVVRDGIDALTALPGPAPAAHRLTLTARIRLAGAGEPAAGELDVTTAGFPDYVLRGLARGIGHAGARPLPLVLLRPANGYFAMTQQSFTPASALDRDFAWHGEGRWTGLETALGEGVLVRAPFLLPDAWSLALHERTTPLYLNRGYPLTLSQEIELVAPAGTRRPRLPESMESARGPLRWRLEWKAEGARLAARLEVVLEKGELDGEETAAFREELRRLYEALGRGAIR